MPCRNNVIQRDGHYFDRCSRATGPEDRGCQAQGHWCPEQNWRRRGYQTQEGIRIENINQRKENDARAFDLPIWESIESWKWIKVNHRETQQ